ncbi:MAG: preprotein translocase subunit SecG [Ignavibacteriaceae bacterium]
MYSLLIGLVTIVAIALVIIVLLQSSKGGGLTGTFGGGGGMGTMFGTRRTADFLSKSTWFLGITLAVLAVVINLFFLPGKSTNVERESVIQRSGQQSLPQNPSVPQQQQQLPGDQN